MSIKMTAADCRQITCADLLDGTVALVFLSPTATKIIPLLLLTQQTYCACCAPRGQPPSAAAIKGLFCSSPLMIALIALALKSEMAR